MSNLCDCGCELPLGVYTPTVSRTEPSGRHEMRLLDRSTVYCLCGWAATVEHPDLRKAELVLHELIERYREHLNG